MKKFISNSKKYFSAHKQERARKERTKLEKKRKARATKYKKWLNENDGGNHADH
jgi:hypothetical protein